MSTRKPCAVKKVVSEELPPGWTVKLRVRKKKNEGRKRKTDKYYIDPKTGRVFGSMKQVLHYLETGEITGSRMSKKKCLIDLELGGAQYAPAKDANKRVSRITTGKSDVQCQVDKDCDSKLHSDGEGNGVPDWKANKKMTKVSVKRVSTSTEEKQQDERTDGDFPGNMRATVPPAQAKVPETSTSVNENMITDSGKDVRNDEEEAAIVEHLALDKVELKEKNVNNETNEVSVLKLSQGNVEFNKSLKGMHGSEGHIIREKIRDVLKKLQGPVLLPAGCIPLPPYHHIGTFGSKNNGNVAEPFDSPPTQAIPTPAGGDLAANEGGAPSNNNLLSNSARPNEGVWNDPCFDFAVRILASELKLAGDHPGVPSSFQHGFNSSKLNDA
ncbi:hypothetical protein LIER_06226 [Lithospermum erythrorhizon]|uniref:MBD domain-containing protein n=1 Tax=Lithospermum erythrorhizon TaxID=34254 RepID=A0AAV3P896_LITER